MDPGDPVGVTLQMLGLIGDLGFASALESTENCVCILHNLSYQLEEQLPRGSVRVLRESRHSLAPRPSAVGCFARRSAKITEVTPPRPPGMPELPSE